MLRDGGFSPKTKTINLMLLDGGVGDHIAALSAVNYILTQYPWITPLMWMPDYLVEFAKHVLPPKANVYGMSEMRGKYDPTRPTKTTKWDGIVSPMKIHCSDYAFLKLCDENPENNHKNYLQIKPELITVSHPQFTTKYVVITTGYTAKVREFPAKEINKIAQYLNAHGLTPVFLGQTQTKTGLQHTIQGKFDETIDFTKGINLIDNTTLLEAAAIMAGSEAVIGVDNGLLHLAGCTDAYIIGGFTTVSPSLRMPYRHAIKGWNYDSVTPDHELACKYCQAKTNFLYGHNYVNCIYKDNLCTTQMTAEKFISKLDKIIYKTNINP